MDVCCPKFNPKPWNEKILVWKNKKFVKGKVFTFFFMPLNFGGVITSLMKQIENSGAKCVNNLTLSEHTSNWNMDLYLAVDKKIPNVENIALSGKYASKVYEGSYSDIGKWSTDFENYLKKKKFSMKKMFMWYTTCPKCAKKYGKNYVVIIAELK